MALAKLQVHTIPPKDLSRVTNGLERFLWDVQLMRTRWESITAEQSVSEVISFVEENAHTERTGSGKD